MKLLQAAHLLSTFPEPETLDQEATDALLQTAEAFLRGGGSVTLTEWGCLTQVSQSALIIAGNKIRTEQAAKIGHATEGPEAVADVMSEVDGGLTKARLNLAVAVAAAAENSKGQLVN